MKSLSIFILWGQEGKKKSSKIKLSHTSKKNLKWFEKGAKKGTTGL